MCREKQVVEEPEVIYEAKDEDSDNEMVHMLPTHRLPAPSDSER